MTVDGGGIRKVPRSGGVVAEQGEEVVFEKLRCFWRASHHTAGEQCDPEHGCEER